LYACIDVAISADVFYVMKQSFPDGAPLHELARMVQVDEGLLRKSSRPVVSRTNSSVMQDG
jgi:hypothetical protein